MKLTYKEFLQDGIDRGGFMMDDIIAALVPLFKKVKSVHDEGKVVKLNRHDKLYIDQSAITFDDDLKTKSISNKSELSKLIAFNGRAFDITGEEDHSISLDTEEGSIDNKDLQEDLSKKITKPVFLPGYSNYEELIGHHDELTDIFSLGQYLSAIALGLDFSKKDEFKTFVEFRDNVYGYNSGIHPIVAQMIIDMTELDRTKRARDLSHIIFQLENYLNYDPENELDLSKIEGFESQDISTRRNYVLDKLKTRLFDLSKRNKLLHFKENLKFINLTVSSVPIVLDYKNIRPESLFLWNTDVSSAVVKTKPIALSKYISFADKTYSANTLNKIRSQSIKTRNELGFNQLRMVVAFLRWHNLKDNKNERINSPLLLIPAELTKKKGVKDQFILTPTTSTAEVNPVLVYYLKELYDINLPDSIQLDEVTIEDFYESLRKQILHSKAGIKLELVQKPKIKLIHTQAKRTYNLFQKKLRGRVSSSFKDLAYSYSRRNFKPLGLEIFKSKVKSSVNSIRFLLDDNVKLEQAVASKTKTREFYQIQDGLDEISPYNWEVDLCNITLGNFDYRKMSLVGDYNQLLEDKFDNSIFDDVFSLEPKQLIEENNQAPELDSQFHVVAADPTQTKAIAFASEGESFIIQGPPGTGKSQTITNLISDYVARGKKVLFICEKRAAIDVVYYRLKQQGLDELCCRIHDSQSDKKSFVMDLKDSYERSLAGGPSLSALTRKRGELIGQLNQELSVLSRFSEAMNQTHDSIQVPLYKLIFRLIELKDRHIEISEEEFELLPEYAQWNEAGRYLVQLTDVLKELGENERFASHPVSTINEDLLKAENPIARINELLIRLDVKIEGLIEEVDSANIEQNYKNNVDSILEICSQAEMLGDLAKSENLNLLDHESEEYKIFLNTLEELRTRRSNLKKEKTDTVNWIEKLSKTDLKNALELIDKYENSMFSFLKGDYRALKRSISERYDFEKHAVKPSFKQVLVDLKEEFEADEALNEYELEMGRKLQITGFKETQEQLDKLHQLLKVPEGEIIDYLRKHADGSKMILTLLHLQTNLQELLQDLNPLFKNSGKYSLTEIKNNLEGLQASLSILPEIVPSLQELLDAPEDFVNAVKSIPMNVEEAEAAFGRKSLQSIYRTNRYLARIEGRLIEQRLTNIEELYEQLFDLNALIVRARVRENFIDHINISSQSVSTLTNDQKKFKKSYSAGRKKLEHEFNKVMRYKPIRELVSTESGQVIRDLKPVWLMSPLSVSDTLPLSTDNFDVVIFDEASQITLEEGIPSIFRAKQAIIVGDEMQMPPTKFFSSKGVDNDDLDQEELEFEEVELDADSLLSQAARNLSSRMLGWHYRSRHEALIGFSNSAFYGNNLLTIPDNSINSNKLDDLIIENLDDSPIRVDALFDRSISFHKLETSVYESRTNKGEARYIAKLVRELLVEKKAGLSIGIVAFSKEQQIEIENALSDLAAQDEVFYAALEKEYERVEDDQFVGLIIKNLENIQGDERDIIIMSVCYGYNEKGRMLMNFGPINRNGGEKRLNVIFSRAKKHMAIVSSIRHYDIKNDYNEGANYFRKFLQYAEFISKGSLSSANLTLNSLSKQYIQVEEDQEIDIITKTIADRLNESGYDTDLNIGQSYFKCSIGVRVKGETSNYKLGILIDNESHYQNNNILEQYYLRPSILKAFGWKVIQIYSKDWYKDEQRVIDRLLRLLGEKINEEVEDTVDIQKLVEDLEESELERVEIPEPIKKEPKEITVVDPVVIDEIAVESVETSPKPEPVEEEVKEPIQEEPKVKKPKAKKSAPKEKGEPKKKSTKEAVVGEIKPLSKTKEENYMPNPAYRYKNSQYFEFSDERSFKFWEIAQDGINLGIRYGKIGIKGQVQLKTFENEEKAATEIEKLIRSKVSKGYLKID